MPVLVRAQGRHAGRRDRAVVAAMSALLPPERIAADLRVLLGGTGRTSRRVAVLRALERLAMGRR